MTSSIGWKQLHSTVTIRVPKTRLGRWVQWRLALWRYAHVHRRTLCHVVATFKRILESDEQWQ